MGRWAGAARILAGAAAALAAAACTPSDGPGDGAWDVLIVPDRGAGDPGARDGLDAPEAVPPDRGPEAAADGEGPDGAGDPGGGGDGGGDDGREDPGSGDPGPADPGGTDPGGADPGPADAGFDVAVGACAPDDTACWCTNDSHCSSKFHEACRLNRCSPQDHHCHLNLLSGTPCSDDDPCTAGDQCQEGACQPGTFTCECRVDGDCDDGNPCTDGTCDAGTCRQVAGTGPCDDGNPCTEGDACRDGACSFLSRVCECVTAAQCDDGNPCTADGCTAERTCTHAPVAGPCDDGNPCTEGDACDAGACVPGNTVCECVTAAQCDDGNPCTTDSCTVQRTCAHANHTRACDDGDACTTGDACAGGACRGGTITCARCRDGFCFKPDETCSSCPQDCGACPASEADCANDYDDDGDGKTDCGDTDCSALLQCKPATCHADYVLACGDEDSRHASGGDLYGKLPSACGSYELKAGAQTSIYRFSRPATGSVTVRVTLPREQPYHLYVLDTVCNPDTCIRYDRTTDTDSAATVTFTAEGGRDYYVVVQDGANNINFYDLSVTCK